MGWPGYQQVKAEERRAVGRGAGGGRVRGIEGEERAQGVGVSGAASSAPLPREARKKQPGPQWPIG